MRIGIAGFGTVGQFVARIFEGEHELIIADPPKGIGMLRNLDGADFVFICVPTPSLPGGGCDTRHVEAVVTSVRPRQAFICHSTVAIGTTDRLIEAYGVPLVYVPQYAGESPDHYYRQRQNLDFLIIGGYEPAAARVSALFRPVLREGARHHIVEPRLAETAKYMENAYLALKVAFCNEFFDLAGAVGVEYERLRELWLLDHRINPSHTTVTAERGYGGACLPKDVAAVCTTAAALGAPLEIMETAQRVNARQRRAAQKRDAAPASGLTSGEAAG